MDVEQTIREYLPQVMHMSLATVSASRPWVCEVHFAYDDALNLYFRSQTSRRHSQEIAANANVAGNMAVQCGVGEFCKGVVDFEGTAKLLAPGPEQDKAYACISKRLGLGEKILEEAGREDGAKFYQITVTNWAVFGKFDGEKPAKSELSWPQP